MCWCLWSNDRVNISHSWLRVVLLFLQRIQLCYHRWRTLGFIFFFSQRLHLSTYSASCLWPRNRSHVILLAVIFFFFLQLVYILRWLLQLCVCVGDIFFYAIFFMVWCNPPTPLCELNKAHMKEEHTLYVVFCPPMLMCTEKTFAILHIRLFRMRL